MIKLKHRICIRYSDLDAEKLKALKGQNGVWDIGEIFRYALGVAYGKLMEWRVNPERLKLVNNIVGPDDTEDPLAGLAQQMYDEGLGLVNPGTAPPATVIVEATSVKATPKRRAPGPKPESNHKPKKGAKNARSCDGRKRPPGRRKGSAAKGRPRKTTDG